MWADRALFNRWTGFALLKAEKLATSRRALVASASGSRDWVIGDRLSSDRTRLRLGVCANLGAAAEAQEATERAKVRGERIGIGLHNQHVNGLHGRGGDSERRSLAHGQRLGRERAGDGESRQDAQRHANHVERHAKLHDAHGRARRIARLRFGLAAEATAQARIAEGPQCGADGACEAGDGESATSEGERRQVAAQTRKGR